MGAGRRFLKIPSHIKTVWVLKKKEGKEKGGEGGAGNECWQNFRLIEEKRRSPLEELRAVIQRGGDEAVSFSMNSYYKGKGVMLDY